MPKHIHKRFDGADEFLEWATHAPCLWRTPDLHSRRSYNNWTAFTGTQDYEEAYNLAKYGWEDGLKQLTAQVNLATKLTPPSPHRKKQYAMAGYAPSPGRAAAGDIFNMVTRGQEFRQKPVITIRGSFSVLSDVRAEHIMRWGASICSYINRLEQSGVSTELEWLEESKPLHGYDGPNVSFSFPLKKAGQRLSLASVVFWIAHPSALRRICFSGSERLDIEEWYHDGYGKSAYDITPCPADTLFLCIKDARYTLEENLAVIRSKHLALLQKHPIPGLAPALEM